MRFLAEGPNFPDELLLARDEGRLVIFCGSGVSRAFAGLPDFFRLAKHTLDALCPSVDSPAKLAFEQMERISAQDQISPLSIDRVFGLLEHEFEERDIESAIGNALRHTPSPNLQAHKALLRLAKTSSGLTRLVTTNFDHLFELSDPTLPFYYPPSLPDPDRPDQFNGIIYLHGRLQDGYESAEGDGLVLSSSSFGNAYLADGWATDFFVRLLDKYFVLFVGYSADDPPITYLLEGLQKTKGMLRNAYALQAARSSESARQWARKGIELIPYCESDNHALLWSSIEKWAERAEDPQLWVDNVIERARTGPSSLLAHERGQVAHIISTRQGMRRFAEGHEPPPAEWLCVFDRNIRYLSPGSNDPFIDSGAEIDPFDLYGLDSDPLPAFVPPDSPNEKRMVPAKAWSAFDLTRLDLKDLQRSLAARPSSIWFERDITLPPRLIYIGLWLRKCAKDPALLWWLLRAQHLPQRIFEQIYEHTLTTSKPETFNPITAISELRAMWSRPDDPHDFSVFDLEREIRVHGWSQARMDAYLALRRPYLELKPSLRYGVCPPSSGSVSPDDLVYRRISYPNLPISPTIPDTWLSRYVSGIRRNLEHACRLAENTSAYSFYSLPSILEDPSDRHYGRDRGLARDVIEYCACLQRLTQYDPAAGRVEFRRWPPPSDVLFSRLYIWALRIPDLVPPSKVLRILREIPRRHLWDSHNARDLFASLESRWSDTSEASRYSIESRLLKGPVRYENETAEQYDRRSKLQTLELFEFLRESGCALSNRTLEVISDLRVDLPELDPDSAQELPRSMGPRGGTVNVDTDYSLLLNAAIPNVVETAREISGRSSDFLVRSDPFLGLSRDWPCRAISALRAITTPSDLPKQEWETFLNEPSRAEDKPRLTKFIAQVLISYPNELVAPIIGSVTEWLNKSSQELSRASQALFNAMLAKTISVLEDQPDSGASKVHVGHGPRDWASESINSPGGKLAQSLFDHPSILGLAKGATFPEDWKITAERLLNLEDDIRCHALVIFGYGLSHCYLVDPEWAERCLLSCLSNEGGKDEHAIWSGYIWHGKVPPAELFPRLKPYFLRKTKLSLDDDTRSVEVVATHLISAWISNASPPNGDRFLSDLELRYALIEGSEQFRSHVLHEFQYKLTQSSGVSLSRWTDLSVNLFETVWPLQSALKTSRMSSALCGVLFANPQSFADIFPHVRRFLTVIYPGDYIRPAYRHGWETFVEADAEKVLDVLFITLPVDANDWPYEIEGVVMSVAEANSGLTADPRFLELMRRWNSR